MIASQRAWLAAAALCLLPLAPALAAATSLAAAATALAPGEYVWTDDGATPAPAPISVVVSIADQRAYVYRGTALVAVSAVSTGKEGHETPLGTFTVLQKAVTHRSNKYENAPMPYMQRLTWDGIAIHGGFNPGRPASHGCVRVPLDFAKKLYAATRLGATVTITDMPVVDTDAPPLEAAAPQAPLADPLAPAPLLPTTTAATGSMGN